MNSKQKCKPSWHSFFSKNFITIYLAIALVLLINQIVFTVLLRNRESAQALFIPPAPLPVNFTAPITYTAGTTPIHIATGDFNNDGYADMAAANYNSNDVSIFLNNQDGTFATAVNYVIPNPFVCFFVAPNMPLVGDYNEDGNLDVAVVGEACAVTILLGDGTGAFTVGNSYQPLHGSLGAVADFNQDGHLDLAVSNESVSMISMLIGDGTGAFSLTNNGVPVPLHPWEIISADFNNDNYPDIATGNYAFGYGSTNGPVAVFINDGTGNFNFAAPTNYDTFQKLLALASADFNGDGYKDIAVSNQDGSVSILINNRGSSGTFASPVIYNLPAITNSITWLATADFNSDGRMDIVVSDENTGDSYFLIGNGDGTFKTPFAFALGSLSSINTDDFDNDHKPDIAGPQQLGNIVSVALNMSPIPKVSLGSAGNCTVLINGGETSTNDKNVTLNITMDNGEVPNQIAMSNDGNFFTPIDWQPYSTAAVWVLGNTSGPGTKTVYVKVKDNTDRTNECSATIEYMQINLASPAETTGTGTSGAGALCDTENLILHGSEPAIALPSGVQIGDLVKRADYSAVYFVGNDNRRHPFPNETVYFSWFSDFSNIQTISAEALAAIPIGSNVTVRPGTYLIKIETDPRVYAVEQYGVIRWIVSEPLANELYGSSWKNKVVDINSSFFTDYQTGCNISSSVHPTGALIKYAGSSDIFYIENGQKRLIQPTVFNKNLFQDRFLNENIPTTISYAFGDDMVMKPIADLMSLR